MSDEIYGCEKGIVIPVPSLLVDLKTNEFQMGKKYHLTRLTCRPVRRPIANICYCV